MTDPGAEAPTMPGGPAEPPVHPPPDPHTDRPLIVCLALALVLGLAAGTQYVAWRFHYPLSLGAPLVVVPAHAARWLRATGVLAAGTALVGVLVPWLRPLSVTLAIVAAGAALASVGPIYAPYRIFGWYAANSNGAAAAPVFRGAWVVVVAVTVAAAVAVTTMWRRRRSPPSDSHGSAHWGDAEALHRPRGLLLGRQGRQLPPGARGGAVLAG